MYMDPSVAIQLGILVILLACSAFFSSSETALTTANMFRMKSLAESGNRSAKRVLKVTDDKGKMLSAILIGNNIVNIGASSLATTLAIDFFGSVGAGIATGVMTVLVLIFGEISPKTLATRRADSLALTVAPIILFLMTVLTPIILVINALSNAFLRLFGVDAKQGNDALTEDELRTIINESHESGEIHADSHEVINNIFDFHDAQAKEIMVPRIDMTVANINCTYDELLEIYSEDKLTRIPIFEDTQDNIVGIVNMKDLLLIKDKEKFSIKKIMREPFFTYEHKNTAELFVKMRDESINMAIVLDEYGDVAGLITLEDLIEEIVGEIHDEYDEEEIFIQEIGDREYEVLGSMNIDDVADELDIPIESEDYDSIAGYVFGLLDRLPAVGNDVTDEHGIYFKVLSMDKNRIERLYIKLPEPILDSEEDD